MRPTGDLHQAAFGIGEETVISHIVVGLQISAILFQKPLLSKLDLIHRE
jgi:hypothetical protein